MEWGLFEKIIDECLQEDEFQVICLMLQNEPGLDIDFLKRVEYIQARSSDRIKISTVTNGSLLLGKYMSQLIHKDGIEIVVSLNALSEDVFFEIQRTKMLGKITEQIENFSENIANRKKIVVSFVVTKDNISEAKPFHSFWNKKGIQTRTYFACDRIGQVDDKSQFIEAPKTQFCEQPFEKIHILASGDVIQCCHDWTHKKIFGNVGNQKIRDIWNGEGFNDVRSRILERRIDSIDMCKNCTSRTPQADLELMLVNTNQADGFFDLKSENIYKKTTSIDNSRLGEYKFPLYQNPNVGVYAIKEDVYEFCDLENLDTFTLDCKHVWVLEIVTVLDSDNDIILSYAKKFDLSESESEKELTDIIELLTSQRIALSELVGNTKQSFFVPIMVKLISDEKEWACSIVEWNDGQVFLTGDFKDLPSKNLHLELMIRDICSVSESINIISKDDEKLKVVFKDPSAPLLKTCYEDRLFYRR